MVKTLYIGLGGLGMRVVSMIKKIQNDENAFYMILDRDRYDLYNISEKAEIPFVEMCPRMLFKDVIDSFNSVHSVEDWFPMSPSYYRCDLYNIGNVRAAGRVSFLYIMESGHLRIIKDLLNKLFSDSIFGSRLRVVIISSLAGGTGSGAFMQLALWIRAQIAKVGFENYEIGGFFVGPEAFVKSMQGIRNNSNLLESFWGNTYAALKELELITKIKQSEDSSLVPYRICLDGLFDSNYIRDVKPVFDRIYMYNDYEDAEDNLSFDEYIKRFAKTVCLRFPSIAGESLSQIQNYMNTLPEMKKMYQRKCDFARKPSGEPHNPHLDKRWLDLFND